MAATKPKTFEVTLVSGPLDGLTKTLTWEDWKRAKANGLTFCYVTQQYETGFAVSPDLPVAPPRFKQCRYFAVKAEIGKKRVYVNRLVHETYSASFKLSDPFSVVENAGD